MWSSQLNVSVCKGCWENGLPFVEHSFITMAMVQGSTPIPTFQGPIPSIKFTNENVCHKTNEISGEYQGVPQRHPLTTCFLSCSASGLLFVRWIYCGMPLRKCHNTGRCLVWTHATGNVPYSRHWLYGLFKVRNYVVTFSYQLPIPDDDYIVSSLE